MTSHDLHALLIDAPVGRHFAQLHTTDATIVESVGLFTMTGLKRHQTVLALTTRDHAAQLDQYLWFYDVDADAARAEGRLVVRDADEMLERFMRAGVPDWALFRREVGGLLDGLEADGRTATRAFGEMVNVLWHRGERDAAHRLEEYWNELFRLYPFALFCCYSAPGIGSECRAALDAMCRTHTDIFGDPDPRS